VAALHLGITQYLLYRRLVWPHCQSGWMGRLCSSVYFVVWLIHNWYWFCSSSFISPV